MHKLLHQFLLNSVESWYMDMEESIRFWW